MSEPGLLDVLKKKVNVHGEIHLDAEQAKILLQWVASIETTLEQQQTLVDEMNALFRSIYE